MAALPLFETAPITDVASPPAPTFRRTPESSSSASPPSSPSESATTPHNGSPDQAFQKMPLPADSHPAPPANPPAPLPRSENRRPPPIFHSSWHFRSPQDLRPSSPRSPSVPKPSPD